MVTSKFLYHNQCYKLVSKNVTSSYSVHILADILWDLMRCKLTLSSSNLNRSHELWTYCKFKESDEIFTRLLSDSCHSLVSHSHLTKRIRVEKTSSHPNLVTQLLYNFHASLIACITVKQNSHPNLVTHDHSTLIQITWMLVWELSMI